MEFKVGDKVCRSWMKDDSGEVKEFGVFLAPWRWHNIKYYSQRILYVYTVSYLIATGDFLEAT